MEAAILKTELCEKNIHKMVTSPAPFYVVFISFSPDFYGVWSF